MQKLLAMILLLSCASACMSSEPEVRLKGERFTVEVMDNDKDRALGLMFRDKLETDHGMLFIFPTEGQRAFWMKNTRIPLDIFYFDHELKLVSVAENAKPCRVQQCPTYPSAAPATYVLELNAGKAAELGVQPGDVLELHLE